MSDKDSPGNTIKFTDEHIKKIEAGKKTSTLRTIKKDNFYSEGSTAQIEGTDIELGIYDRSIVKIGSFNRPLNTDVGCFIDGQELAESEGFKDYTSLIGWFKQRDYNLPQNLFRYRFYILNPEQRQQQLGEVTE